MYFFSLFILFFFFLIYIKIVLFSMKKYNKLLKERLALAEDIRYIKEQNTELKALLRQYMNAKINEELEVPPTQIMFAQAGILRSPRRKINNGHNNREVLTTVTNGN